MAKRPRYSKPEDKTLSYFTVLATSFILVTFLQQQTSNAILFVALNGALWLKERNETG
jgi:hypothetical protein